MRPVNGTKTNTKPVFVGETVVFVFVFEWSELLRGNSERR